MRLIGYRQDSDQGGMHHSKEMVEDKALNRIRHLNSNILYRIFNFN